MVRVILGSVWVGFCVMIATRMEWQGFSFYQNFGQLTGVGIGALPGVLLIWFGMGKPGWQRAEPEVSQPAHWDAALGKPLAVPGFNPGAGLPAPDIDAEPAPRPRGPLFWAREVGLFPLRIFGVLTLILIVPGMVFMSRLPALGRQHDVELCLLTLRALNRDKAARPFLPLGYRPGIQEKIVDLSPETTYFDGFLTLATLGALQPQAVSCKAKNVEGGRRYLVKYTRTAPRKVEATTPHLTVSHDEIAQARAAVTRIFEPANETQWAELLQWGESLFWTEWLRMQYFSSVPKALVPEPLGGTEDERLWLVWQVLRGSDPAADTELLQLPELFNKAFPTSEERDTSLAWAQGFYERLEKDHKAWRRFLGKQAPKKDDAPATSKKKRREAPMTLSEEETQLVALERVLPPKSPWTYQWLVYRYAGLTDASRQAARQHWLSRFPAVNEARVLEFGQAILEERRAAGDPLPAVPENLPLLCVAERLTGSDPYGQRCRLILERGYHKHDEKLMSYALYMTYPNDELFFLQASPDALQMHPRSGHESSLTNRCQRLAGNTFVILIGALGLSTLVNWGLTRMLLRSARAKSLWAKHMHGRGREPIWLWLLSVIAFAALGVLAAPMGLPEAIAIQIESPLELFLGSLTATAVGGVMIGTCRRIIAVVLVAFRVDIETSWLDEVLGILAGGLLLLHFGNALIGIALFALSDLAPQLVEVAMHRAPAPRRGAVPRPLAAYRSH